jgi:dTDP-glucose 4,6-dehydratase
MKDQTIVVTGAAGFIGSHLTEALLKKQAKVRALVKYNSRSDAGFLSENAINNPNLELIFGDVRDPFAVNKLLEGATSVYHLAALIGIPYSYTAPQSYVDTNINGTLNILEAAKTNNLEHVILTSTSEVYGTALHTPMSETHPLQAQSPYSASKISADMLGYSYAKSFALPLTIIRPFNTFGPRQSMRAVIPTIIVQALTGDTVKLGDTTPVRDFNFVSNTVEGFLAANNDKQKNAEAFNICSGEGISIGDTAKLIGKILGKDLKIECDQTRVRPQNSEVRKLIGDSTKARTDLSWQPTTSFEDGLRQTISWVKENLSLYSNTQRYTK